jgi:hypothetical protein
MKTGSAQIILASPPLGFIEFAVRAAVLELTALVDVYRDEDAIYEPDPWSTETPFLKLEWPRS